MSRGGPRSRPAGESNRLARLGAELMPWWTNDPLRWAGEVEVMERAYPAFTWGERLDGSTPVRFWTGVLQPLSPESDIDPILADLAANRHVVVSTNGRLAHDIQCYGPHKLPRKLHNLGGLDQAFHLDACHRPPPAPPLVRSIDPEISRRRFPEHPHLYGETGELCPLFPPDVPIGTEPITLADYLDQVALYLVKHQVWEETAKWIGRHVDHRVLDWAVKLGDRLLLRDLGVRPNDPCWCRSGKRAIKCHLRHLYRVGAHRRIWPPFR